MGREVVVVGAGVVGVSLASALAARGVDVTVLERDPQQPRGSTAYAPGFIGLYNDAPVLTALAIESALRYDTLPGFTRSGGLELATTSDGEQEIARRVTAARAHGLRATLLDPAELPAVVSDFVEVGEVQGVGYFAGDGCADVSAVVKRMRSEAVSWGARFAAGTEVTAIDSTGPRIAVTTAAGERIAADDVVLASGVWGGELAARTGLELPLIPVAHPYVYDAAVSAWHPGPFVRWPEHHVYARIHGDRLGIGTYDHRPVPVTADQLVAGAGLGWSADFDEPVAAAQRLLRAEARFDPVDRVNGVFAMTPDNLPFVGQHPNLDRVWIAQAIWVTHAAGAARVLVDALLGRAAPPAELDPGRFSGSDPAVARDRALRLYRDIYADGRGISDCATK